MQTPIVDFVKNYANSNTTRFHMPGHKGVSFLGCEPYDITEINNADALYEANGIIAQSELNATALFGTKRTLYSTEGSSQCIRAMLYLSLISQKRNNRAYVIATRNAHKAFLYAVALLDLDVVWLYPENIHSLCSCMINATDLEDELSRQEEPPIAVYVTSPDYLGGTLDITSLAEVCHAHKTLLAVDNAHGAYLHFLPEAAHPMDLGADLCCDSAHKTLPVLTGGAYLHISKQAPSILAEQAKQAMVLFGSTSPSYLTLSSLDMCNQYISSFYPEQLNCFITKLESTKRTLKENGWEVLDTDPLKLTIQCPYDCSGIELAQKLRNKDIECEYADNQYLVLMLTIENTEDELVKLISSLGKNVFETISPHSMRAVHTRQILSVREAIFREHEILPIEEALGRICGAPMVSCPPAIPIIVSGEEIDENAIELLKHYDFNEIEVCK